MPKEERARARLESCHLNSSCCWSRRAHTYSTIEDIKSLIHIACISSTEEKVLSHVQIHQAAQPSPQEQLHQPQPKRAVPGQAPVWFVCHSSSPWSFRRSYRPKPQAASQGWGQGEGQIPSWQLLLPTQPWCQAVGSTGREGRMSSQPVTAHEHGAQSELLCTTTAFFSRGRASILCSGAGASCQPSALQVQPVTLPWQGGFPALHHYLHSALHTQQNCKTVWGTEIMFLCCIQRRKHCSFAPLQYCISLLLSILSHLLLFLISYLHFWSDLYSEEMPSGSWL